MQAKSKNSLQTPNKNIIEGEILQDVSKTGKKRDWENKKADNLKLVELFKIAYRQDKTIITSSRIFNLEQCGEILEFAMDANNNKQLTKAYFCRIRLCPICQWRRSLKLFGQVSAVTDKILQDYKGVRFLFVTLTQKNVAGQNLQAELNNINVAFSKITNKTKKFALAGTLIKNLLGYVKSMEITYNVKSNTYHPHLHCVFAVKSSYFKSGYITHAGWQEIWQNAMDLDYVPQVNVKNINLKEQPKAIAELTKYPAKTTNIYSLDTNKAVDVLKTLTATCHKRRFVTFGGIFRTVKQQLRFQDVENSKADLIHVDGENVENLNAVAKVIYKYNAKFGVYIKEQ